MYENVIWDFNGTIIDDVKVGLDALNVLLKKYGYKPITDNDYYKSIFGFPIKDYYARAGFDFDEISYDTLAPEWVEEYLAHEPEAPIINGVKDAFDAFKGAGIKQFLVSATEIGMLTDQLNARGIFSVFDGVFGLDNIKAAGKTDIVREVISSLQGRTVMIGDTIHDAECADAAGVDIILVAAGHQSYERLKASGHKTVHTIGEAVNIILG
ncbi:MAG: HAD family hydrolase [Clostridia bacterium]|nr:HAD family hydrolase [Clostridia bacterium]